MSPSTLRRFSRNVAVVGAAAALSSCTPTRSSEPEPPQPSACGEAATTSEELRARLAGATTGACVALAAGTYDGPLTIAAGTSLVAASGARPVLRGGSAEAPVVTLEEGAELSGVDVVDAEGVAVAVRASRASVSAVHVRGAKSAALAVRCEGEACLSGDQAVALTDVTLESSALGAWISGARVVATGLRSSSHQSSGLASAAGLVAQDGAQVRLTGGEIRKSQGAGVLVDGAATRVALEGTIVSENGERGIWVQRTAGSLAQPSLSLTDCVVERNRIVAVGAVEARGIIIEGGRLADTVAAPLVTHLAKTEQVGDGLGAFRGTGDVRVRRVALVGNARAQGLLDAVAAGIIIEGGRVEAPAGGHKVVVQNTAAQVTVDASVRETLGAPLGVSAPTLPPRRVLP